MKKISESKTGITLLSRWLPMLLLFLVVSSKSFGQGFYKPIFPGSQISTISPERIICTSGGGFTLPMHDGDHAPLAWTQADANGNTLATKHTEPVFSQIQSFIVTNDGNYVVLDSSFNDLIPNQNFLKLSWYDFNGALLQTRNYTIDPLRGYGGIGKVISDDNGDLYVVGLFTNSLNNLLYYALKFNAAGDILWQLPLTNAPTGGFQDINSLTISKDGSLLIDFAPNLMGLGRHVFRKDVNTGFEWDKAVNSFQVGMPIAGDATGGTFICAMEKIFYSDATQSVTWTKDMRTLLNDQGVTYANYCLPVTGGWVFLAYSSTSIKIFKLDAAGNLLWVRSNLALLPGFHTVSAGKELPDGSLVFGASYGELPHLLKLNPDGTLFSHEISGQVVNDLNLNCLADAGDLPTPGKIILAERQSDGFQNIGMTDINGNYSIVDVDTGTYLVRVVPPNFQWQTCGTGATVVFTDPDVPGTANEDFQLQVLYNCPLLWTSVSTSQLRVCQIEQYVLQYCNAGTQAATNAFVELTLPPEFLVEFASAPYTLVAPNKLHFEVGTVPVDSCGTIYIDVYLDCDQALFGQTLCVSAAAYPDTTCFPQFGPWSGASIEVVGHCDPDSVRLEIINSGSGSTDHPLDFIIVEDHVISLQGQFALPGGANRIITLPKNGSTWRIQADQEPNHPLGMDPATVALEGCVLNGNSFSTGMVNLFANNSGHAAESINCHQVLNGYDPNVKLGFPIGLHEEHFIEPNTTIEYQINFQNTGNATTINVLLKDTLSPFLDHSSIRMGAASHPYTWSLSGAGILQVRFDNINLPDSNSNEAASHGFVRFRIAQKLNNPLETIIENQAGIYFDANTVVVTNLVKHTLGENFIEVVVAAVEPSKTPITVKVQPNPAATSAIISFENTMGTAQLFHLYDVAGKQIRTQEFSGNELNFLREGLPSGLYFFAITNNDGKKIAQGKLMLK